MSVFGSDGSLRRNIRWGKGEGLVLKSPSPCHSALRFVHHTPAADGLQDLDVPDAGRIDGFNITVEQYKIGKTARLEGARLNVERMRSIAGKRTPQFIVGDMNATAGTPGGVCLEPYFKWLKSACEEAPQTDPRPTYHGFGKAKPLHIDHIFYRCAEPLRYQLLDSTGYGVQYLSDHYPIVCTFRF